MYNNGFNGVNGGGGAGTPPPVGNSDGRAAVNGQDSKIVRFATEIGTSGGPDVYRAISQVIKDISRDGISKGRRNEQQGYAFRGIDDIYNALSGLIAAADLCILPRMSERRQEERQTAKGGVLFYVTVRAEFDFVSVRDGSTHTVSMYGEAMDSADKATNKAMSAAYKYACMQVFCIPTEGMEDADGQTLKPAGKTAPRAMGIDTGGNVIGTQAAANHVRDQKLAAGTGDCAPPWRTMGEMRRLFEAARERVGEVAFLEELSRWGWKSFSEMKTAIDNNRPNARQLAIESYRHLEILKGKQ